MHASLLIEPRWTCSRSMTHGFGFPFAEYLLDAPDDPIARNQHAPDDDQTEHHELQGGGEPHRSQHLVESREEDGGCER